MPLVSDKRFTGGWRRRLVTLKMFDIDKSPPRGVAPRRLEAAVKGPLAVHQTVNYNEPPEVWSVTHVSTGWRLLAVRGESAARKVVESLLKHAADGMNTTTKAALEAVTPDRVVAWLRACRAAKACLDIASFLEG